MADPRQWPGFRVEDSDYVKRTVPDAAADLTFPQAAVLRSAERVTLPEKRNREALTNGKTSTLADHQHVMAKTIRFVPGGRKTVIGLIYRAVLNHDPDAKAWWNIYAELLPADQDRVDLDVICEHSGVAPDRLMAVVVSTAMRFGADAADLVAATTQPLLIHQTAKSAMRIGGQYATIAQKDREMLLQHHKFIPAKGPSIQVTTNAHAQAAATAAAQSQPSVPTFSDTINGAMSAHRSIQGELVGSEETEDA